MKNKTIIKEACPTSTQQLIARGYIFLDVRENIECQKLTFDVPKIIYIPLSELEDRFLEIPKEENIIVVCQTGERSFRAVGFLQQNGFTKVLNMKKGLEKWVQKGFPTKGDASAISQHTCCGSSHC